MVRTESVIDVCCAHYFTILLQKALVDAIVTPSVVWYKINCCCKEISLSHQRKEGKSVIEKVIRGKNKYFMRKKTKMISYTHRYLWTQIKFQVYLCFKLVHNSQGQ